MVKIDRRRMKIFDMLQEHTLGLSGEFISQQLGVSSRTIRSDIKALQDDLIKYNVQIISSPNKGYCFNKFEQLSMIKQQLFSQNANDCNLENAKQRVNYILYKLLKNTFDDTSITQNDLAEEMYISLSTLKTHLNEVKTILKKYDLKIVQYKTKGIKILGDEIKLRYLIVDLANEQYIKEFFQNLLANVNIKMLDSIIKENLTKKHLQLTDKSKEKLCLHIAIAICRCQKEKLIAYPISLANKIEHTLEYTLAKEITDEIYKKLNIDLACAEVYYIAQCLLASKKLFDISESTDKLHVKKLINIILQEIHEKLSIDFTGDEYLIDGLTLHLNIALTRIQFHMNIRNELLDTIKNDYPLAFQMGLIAGKIVEKYDNVKINENEIGYIALHFGAAISRNGIKENVQAKNVIIVCSSGLGISILLKAKIEEYFHNRLNVVKVLPGYEVTENLLENIDYILSTVPLKNIKSNKVIYINRMLQKKDIEKIENEIFNKKSTDLLEITTFFAADNFYVDKDFTTKEECINFLADEAIKKGLMDTNSKLSIFEREEMSSTSIGDLVAIPHPIIANKKNSFISVLLLKQPIMWGDFLVQVVFLLNIERAKVDLWEPLFLKLYNYIKEKKGINSLLKNKSYNVFLEEFMNFI